MERPFGNYRILSQLGEGGFGNVHLGEHMPSGDRRCIKVWRARNEQDVEEFRAEVHILNRLDHPNIIRVLDSGRAGNTAFFATTYAPYGTLRDYYREGTPYPLSTILLHTKQIASALQHIHDQGMVHCNVIPNHF